MRTGVGGSTARRVSRGATWLPHLPTGRQVNKKHWNTILMDGSIGDKLIKQWIDHSYDLVAASLPKKDQAALKAL